MLIETHSVDGVKRGTKSGVHIFPLSRHSAGSADHGGGGGTLESFGDASKSRWPGEEPCSLISTFKCCMSVCMSV